MECDKAVLRARMRALRASDLGAELSEKACAHLTALSAYKNAQKVFCYYSVGGEVDTLALIERMRSDGKTVCLPAILGSGIMEARRMDRLVAGLYGIPSPEGPIVPPEEIDLIVVPGLAFDRLCHRLGRGGGYYDRYLPKCRGVTVGLAYEFQMADSLPLEAHDAQLDFVATESAIYTRP
jgi:5-formyltetrahydrofolate cyclo-ligase